MITEFHIGIDDTDSRFGGCTTYTATTLYQELIARGFKPIDYPWLVRLNPNIPWKTRGNGALSVHFTIREDQINEVKQLAIRIVEDTSDIHEPSTDPALVFLKGPAPENLNNFSRRALHDVLTVKETRQVAASAGAEVFLLKGPRGLVGALASIGAYLDGDHTFEILAYRMKENLGTPRKVSRDSVREMNRLFVGLTFNNVDPETDRVLTCPHGPDPVLLGIRGEDPDSITRAFAQIDIDEPIERTQIFRTNQGTDAHLLFHRRIREIRPHQSVIIAGKVVTPPQVVRGGHVIFRVMDDTGSIDCAAYRSMGPLHDVSLGLLPGDSVVVSGGIRSRPSDEVTLNVEKLEIEALAEWITCENPRCAACNKSCESMGRGQGFRCRKCKVRIPRSQALVKISPRKIAPGIYLPPARAHRHLTKPASRYDIHQGSFANRIELHNSSESMQTVSVP